MRAFLALTVLLAACAPSNVEPEGQQDAGPVCGNGVVEKGEECDNGVRNGPNTGCERDCTYSCLPNDPVRGNAHCDPHDACKGKGTCGFDHICALGAGLPDGEDCGNGHICRDGACQTGVCGDGIIEAGEECDDGVNDGSQGCDSTCHFVCVSNDSTRNCTATDSCAGASTCDDNSHLCSPRTPATNGTPCSGGECEGGQCVTSSCATASDCTPCGTGSICKAGACVASTCGDGCRDTTAGEQCDDGNQVNLDGCDSHCRFEQNQRATAVTMLYAGDSYCTANALGGAVGSSAQSTVQSEINTALQNGTMNVMFAVLGLSDPTGQNGSCTLGPVTGNPVAAPLHVTYNGTSDLDWWYTAQTASLDNSRVPLNQIQASISHASLATTGLGTMTLTLPLGSGPVQLKATSVKAKASVGQASAPTESVRGLTPGHTLGEHLDTSLNAFGSLGNGELCGNISAASLAAAPVAQTLQSGGSASCDQGYGSGNNMLDVIVGGCSHSVFLVGNFIIFTSTQPDQVDPGAPVAGAGGPYKFFMSGGKVASCKDKNGTTVDLTTCKNAAAYSAALTFSSDRVILK